MFIFKDKNQLNQAFLRGGALLAIDVGTKRIGLALSDKSRMIASPKLILKRQSNLKDFAKIKEFIIQNEVSALIIGFPLEVDGEAGEMAKFVKKFAQNLEEFLEKKIPIILFDERLSSFEARKINSSRPEGKKEFYDDIAAAVILEDFIKLIS